MAQDISIAFKASDNLTNSIKQMRTSVSGLTKDVTEYRKIQEQAFEKKSEIKLDISKAKKELSELSKAVQKDAEGSREAFKAKQKEIDLLSEEYRRLAKVAKEASKAELTLQEDISRTSNASATRQPDLIKSLVGAGIGNMLGGAVAGNLGQAVSSMFGNTTGNAISNVAGNAVTGAAMGSIAGPIGVAVGSAVGGLTGAIQALTNVQQKKDDIYSSEVQSLYNQVKQEQQQGLESGIEYESNKEKNLASMSTLLGSSDKGAEMYADIKEFGIDTPYQASSILNSAKQMLAYGISEDDIMSNTQMLGEVAGGDQFKFDSLSYAYAQIQSAGKLRGQDNLQLTAAGFNPLKVLAEEQGTTLEYMTERMSKGLVTAEDVTRAFRIATQEGGRYYGAMADQMETYAGKKSILDDIQAEINGGYGEGYNDKRKQGMELEIEQLTGEIGDKMKEANSLIGEFQANLENEHQQAIIKATEEAMKTNEYQKALSEDNGAEMGKIIAEARAKAEMDYKNSEGYKLLQEADLSLVKSLQEDAALNGAYLDYGYKMGEQFSKGWQSGISGAVKSGKLTMEEEIQLSKQNGGLIGKIGGILAETTLANGEAMKGYATGLDRVPYNGMPAMLHEGERVLTKVEADKLDRKASGVSIAKLADTIVIREDADIDKIATAVVQKVVKAGENYAG